MHRRAPRAGSSSLTEVREARPEDWPAVAALLAELGRPDVRGAADEQHHRAGFEEYLKRDDTVALVAELDGEICGFVDVEFRARLNFFEPQAWVPDLVVAEGRRGHGVGRALLGRAEELARERGCFSITLESANWRTGAHAFYEREGWDQGGKSFGKVLADVVDWPPKPR